MAAFAYSAINVQGLEVSGEINAPDTATAREQLRSRGLLPQTLTEQHTASEGLGGKFKKVKPKSLRSSRGR